MEWKEALTFLFGFMFMAIAGWVASSINSMKNSMSDMNVKLAVMLNDQVHDRKKIADIEEKVNTCCNIRVGTIPLMRHEDRI